MARLTLLDMTQNILSALSSDEVNSISDSTESRQVAEIIKTTYFNIISRANLPQQKDMVQLDSANDITRPVVMIRPAHISKIEWIKYNTENDEPEEPLYTYVTILPSQQFIDMVHSFNPDDANVGILDSGLNDTVLYYKTDKQPQYCMLVGTTYFIFDSYNSVVDTALQSSKTFCLGHIIPTFSLIDSFVPDLEDNQFPLLINEAKSLAFYELKQIQHPKAEREIKRQWSTMQKNKSVTDRPSAFNQLPNFGRR